MTPTLLRLWRRTVRTTGHAGPIALLLLVVAIAIGYGLDRYFGTRPFLLLVFLPLGVAAGVVNVWRQFGRDG